MAEGLTRPEAVSTARAMAGEDEVGDVVLPAAEQPLIRLAVASANRWQRVAVGLGGSVPVAFDLPAVDVAARWLGIIPDARLMSGLAILEREALKIMRTER